MTCAAPATLAVSAPANISEAQIAPADDNASGLRQLGEPAVLAIIVVLGPEELADALEQGGARLWQLLICFGDAAHQTQGQRIAVEVVEAVLIEMPEHLRRIDAAVVRGEEGRRFRPIERLDRQDARFLAVDLC